MGAIYSVHFGHKAPKNPIITLNDLFVMQSFHRLQACGFVCWIQTPVMFSASARKSCWVKIVKSSASSVISCRWRRIWAISSTAKVTDSALIACTNIIIYFSRRIAFHLNCFENDSGFQWLFLQQILFIPFDKPYRKKFQEWLGKQRGFNFIAKLQEQMWWLSSPLVTFKDCVLPLILVSWQ